MRRPQRAGTGNLKDRLRRIRQMELQKQKDAEIANISKAGSDALSSSKKKGAVGSAVGAAGGKWLAGKALSGLLGAVLTPMTGGIINPYTMQMLTAGVGALGAGLGAYGASKAAMGKPNLTAGQDSRWADIRKAGADTQSTLADQVNAQAMQYGMNAAKSAAISGATQGYKGQIKGLDYDKLQGSGVSRFDYDNLTRKSLQDTMMNQGDYDRLVKARQAMWKNQGGDLVDDIQW